MTPLIMNLPTSYALDHVQRSRIIPLIDQKIESVLWQFRNGQHDLDFPIIDSSIVDNEYSADVFGRFKHQILEHVKNSELNQIQGLNSFDNCDITQGCTQFIDNLYIQYGKDNIQVLQGEYMYHYRLFPDTKGKQPGDLEPNKHLIISCPFVTGSMHERMEDILNECEQKNISVHVDMAWLFAAKNVRIDLSKSCIASVGISLSKGYGLSGWNRVGIRLSKQTHKDSISLMTEYYQTLIMPVTTALFFLDRIPVDHLWNKHQSNYNQICKDFGLETTDTVHIARDNDHVLGLTPLLRYLEYHV